jgi:hypothetical protein
MVLVFGVSFAVAGVGSGNGVNPFQSLFNSGGGGGSISGLQKKVQQHPKDAQAWRDLGLALAAKPDRQQEAVNALTRYTELRPKDPAGYSDLAQTQAQQAQGLASQWQLLQAKAFTWQSAATPPIAVTGKLQQAFRSDPVAQATQAQAQQASAAAASARTTARDAYLQALATDRRIEKLRPSDPGPPTDLAAAARSALVNLGQDPVFLATLIGAYQRLEKLDPANAKSYRTQVKQLKRLQAPPHG